MNFVPAAQWAAASVGPPVGPTCSREDTLGVRPEHLQISPHRQGLRATVQRLEHVGDALFVHTGLSASACPVVARLAPDAPTPAVNAELWLQPTAAKVHVFDPLGRTITRPEPINRLRMNS
jgi:multiple sugar transport system ATP-binding protein